MAPFLGVVLAASLLNAVPLVDTSAAAGCSGAVGNASALTAEVAASNASASNDTITLVAGCTYAITATLAVTDGSHKLTISGNGATIDGKNARQLFVVKNGARLVLRDLMLERGKATTPLPPKGGAVFNQNGTVTIERSVITGSTAGGAGGAIYNSAPSTITVADSALTGNTTTGDGAGVYNEGSLELTSSTLSNNGAGNNGGAIFNTGAASVIKSTLSGNSSGNDGGGIHSRGAMALTNTTLSGNRAGRDGGGIHSGGTGALRSSTLTGNMATNRGGGMFLDAGAAAVVDNTIVSGSPSGGNCDGATTATGASNLSNTASCGPSFLVGDPRLGPLASNGGSTRTHELLAGSSAVNAGTNSGCPTADQRGAARARTAGDPCDIGAYESPAGAPAGTVTYYSGGGIKNPRGITAGPDGALWFANAGSNTIGRITTGGAISKYGSGLPANPANTSQSTPDAITTGSDGGVWFTDPGDNSVARIDPTTHAVIRHGSGIGAPQSIAPGSDGALWFPNGFHSIGRINPVNGSINTYSNSLHIRQPHDIASGSDGALWFTNRANSTYRSIGRIDPKAPTTSIQHWGSPQITQAPSAIAAGPDGAIWFSTGDANSDLSIGRIDPVTKTITRRMPVPTRKATGMVTGPDGALWFAYPAGNAFIGRFDPNVNVANSFTKFPTGINSDPFGIAAGPDGAVWFTDHSLDRIGRIQVGPPKTPTLSASPPVILVGTNCPASTCPNGVDPLEAESADFDHDGITDLVTANSLQGVSVRLGNGDGTFRNPPGGATTADVSVSGGAYAAAVADFDKDDHEDLALVGRMQQSSKLTVMLGNGDGTFHAAAGSPVTLGTNARDVAVGFIDGGTHPDLAIANRDDNTVSIVLNDGNPSSPGTFHNASTPTVPFGSWPDSVDVADVDNDGRTDLAATQFGGGVAVARGNGNGTFDPAATFAAGLHPISVKIADLNADTRKDLVVANYTVFCNSIPHPNCDPVADVGTVSVLMGQPSPAGTVSFRPAVQYPAGFNPTWAGVADFDRDGLPDIVNKSTGNNSLGSQMVIHHGYGPTGGMFAPAPSMPIAYAPEKSAIADLNCDAYPDMLVPRNGSDSPPDRVVVLLNTSSGSSAAGCPLPPPTSICPTSGPLLGTPNNDTLIGTPNADVICGLGGNDTLIGKGGNDILIGEAGVDTLEGEGGADSLFGGAGPDVLKGGPDDDGLNGGADVDTCNGGVGVNRFLLC